MQKALVSSQKRGSKQIYILSEAVSTAMISIVVKVAQRLLSWLLEKGGQLCLEEKCFHRN